MRTPFDLTAIGAGLAFARHLAELRATLPGGSCVVQAPPGSGKTTLAPPAVANHLAERGGARKVLVTAPRRIAVRAAAQRLAFLDRSPVGERVGFTIRGERFHSKETLIEFLTPGVLLRRLLAEPEQAGVGAVILDEVHERSLDTDLLLGMLSELRLLREDLLLVAMSATLEAERFADLLGGAPVVRSTGEQHPVEIRYAPFSATKFTERGVSREFLHHVAATTSKALAAGDRSDVLVFLPGRSEIEFVTDALARSHPGVEVFALFSQAGGNVHQRILAGRAAGDPRRVVVATSVAESSLTVPGVHTVVDSGLAREPRRDMRRGMTGLVTITASQAASEQRAGRAGRLGPGLAFRCTDEAAYAAAPAAPTPEVATVDLTSAALMLACWGNPGGEGMALPDPLPTRALAEAHAELRHLGALDEERQPTRLGRQLARLPVDPRLGRALLEGATKVGREPAAEIVALLASDARAEQADLPGLWRAMRSGHHGGAEQWRRERQRLLRLLPAAPAREKPVSGIPRGQHLGYVAALGTGRLARLDGESYLLSSGTRAALPQGSPLAGEPWLIVTDATRSSTRQAAGTGALIRAAAPISRELLEDLVAPTTTRELRVEGGEVRGREVIRFGAIVETSTPVPTTVTENATLLTEHVRYRGLGALPWTPSAQQLRGRLAAAREQLGQGWPDVSDEALLNDLQWLEPYIIEPKLAKVPVSEALSSLVWDRHHELDRLAPARLDVPSGRSVALRYPGPGESGAITASVKLQECFGLRESPRILAGSVPITFELLSPAGRPLAVTADLASFWEQAYPHVRAENRARYAKHPWPEDPWAHRATAATNRQLQRRQ